MKKRLLAALLAVGILAALASVGALAAEGGHRHDVSSACGDEDPADLLVWDDADRLPDGAGCYYLTGDVTLHDVWAVPEGATRLCLNGHTITGPGDRSVIRLEAGAALTICDCRGTGKVTGGGGEQGGGVYIASGGSLELCGGAVTGNGAETGGGVYVDGGTFVMSGGRASGNTAGQGGGVYAASGTVTLSGAPVISGNTCGEAAENLCLDRAGLTVNALTDGASIGLFLAEPSEDGSAVALTGACPGDLSSFFTSDRTGWEVVCGEDNALQLRAKTSVAQGQCGASGAESAVTWNLSGAGLLTISGEGAVADYLSAQSRYAPWRPYRESIRRVIVAPGVTALGSQVFCNEYSALSAVSLPDSLVRLGDYAFGGCTALEEVEFPSSLTTVGEGAFSGCTALSQLTVPVTLTHIGDSAFSGCTALETLEFQDGVAAVSWGGFWGCTALEEVVLPASVTAVGANAFHDCPAIARVRYGGTKAQWTALTAPANTAFASGNNALKAAPSILCSDGTITNAPPVLEGFVIRFDANGGEGTMSGVRVDEGSRYNLPPCLFTPPVGQQFKCWSVDGQEVAPGTRIAVEKDLTAVAVWEAMSQVVLTQISFGGASAPTIGTRATLPKLTVDTTPKVTVENYTAQYLQLRADYDAVEARFKKGQITQDDRDAALAFLDSQLDALKKAPADDRMGVVAYWADPGTGQPFSGTFQKGEYTLVIFLGNRSESSAVSFSPQPTVLVGKRTVPVVLPVGRAASSCLLEVDEDGRGCLILKYTYNAASAGGGGGGGGNGSTGGGGGAPVPEDKAEPAAQPVWSNPFADVAQEDWYYADVAFCHAQGLMSGTGTSSFAPGDVLSRAMLAQILYNKEGRPACDSTGAFSDLDAGAWYGDAVSWAAAKGIVEGYADGRFGPGDGITREQLAVMLWRYAGRPATDRMDHLAGFSDRGHISGYAEAAMQWAVAKGILNGKGADRLDPLGGATRAEAAAMLRRFVSGQDK